MKAVVVVALIALCACAFEMPKLPKAKHAPLNLKAFRDDPEIKYFTQELECAFHVDYKKYETTTSKDYEYKGTLYIGGNHSCMSYKYDLSGIEMKMKEIVRADITSGSNLCYIITASAKYQGEEAYECGFQMFDPDYYVPDAYEMREVLATPMPYTDIEKDYKWTDDVKCDRYYVPGFEDTFQFCVKEEHIVGFDFYGERMALEDYKMSASKDDFAVSKKYEGCESMEKIYEDAEPVPADCELKDAAAAVKAVAAVVLAMMALFF
jgi:hypothetical protein